MRIGRNTLLVAVVAGTVGTMACAGYGQSRPADPPDDRPQVSSPYWGGSGATSNAQTPAVGEQLLTQTVMAVPQARADAVVARWTYRRLDRQLNQTADGMRRDFRDSDEYAHAMDDFRNAYAELESARVRATRTLIDSPEYQAAMEQRKGLTDQIADEHDLKKPDRDRLTALASLKLDFIGPIRALEMDAFSTDPAVREARAKLIETARRLTRLEKEFARDVRESIELAGIRKSREDARIAMLASSAFLQEMRLARSIALQFAYVGQGYDLLNPGYHRRYGYGYQYGGYYHGGFYGGRGVAGLGGFNYRGPVGVIGNSPFGAGTNAIIGPGPGSR